MLFLIYSSQQKMGRLNRPFIQIGKLRHEEVSNSLKVTASMREIYAVIQKHLLSNCYVLGPGLGAGKTARSKIKHL